MSVGIIIIVYVQSPGPPFTHCTLSSSASEMREISFIYNTILYDPPSYFSVITPSTHPPTHPNTQKAEAEILTAF